MDDLPIRRTSRRALLAGALLAAALPGLADDRTARLPHAPPEFAAAEARHVAASRALDLEYVPADDVHYTPQDWRRHRLADGIAAREMDGDIVTKDVIRMLLGRRPLPIDAAGATEISLDYDDDSDFGLKFERRVQR